MDFKSVKKHAAEAATVLKKIVLKNFVKITGKHLY